MYGRKELKKSSKKFGHFKSQQKVFYPKQIEKEKITGLNNDLTTNEKNILKNFIDKNSNTFAYKFTDTCVTKLIQSNVDTERAKPIRCNPYKENKKNSIIIEGLVKKLLKLNIISLSNSSWASPAFVTQDENGRYRLRVNYECLNSVTKKDKYSLPKIDEILSNLGDSKIFTRLKIRSGYYSIGMNDEDKEKTAFITKTGLYHFNVMPFGLTNSSVTYHKLLDQVFNGLLCEKVIFFYGSILIFSENFEEHMLHLQTVFDRIYESGLRLNKSKCLFCVPELIYLGYFINQNGFLPDSEKIQMVEKIEQLKNISEVRCFLGKLSYYSKFIRNLSNLEIPLKELQKKNKEFVWGEEQKIAFQKLKRELLNLPLLSHFCFGLDTELRTNVSDNSLNATLVQKHSDGWRVLGYASRLIKKKERSYLITDLECEAVIFGIQKFMAYLEKDFFKIVTDHCSLCYIKKNPIIPDRLLNHVTILEQLDFEIFYKSGSLNYEKNYLFRYPANEHDCEIISKFENKEENYANFIIV